MPHNKYISQAGTHRRMCIGNSEDMELWNAPSSSIVALSTFYHIWSTDFLNIVIPEVKVIALSH